MCLCSQYNKINSLKGVYQGRPAHMTKLHPTTYSTTKAPTMAKYKK